MKTISFLQFKSLEKQDSYYRGRWGYFNEVINIINSENPKSVLELGPYKRPIVEGSDTIDLNPHFPNLAYHHDATKIPWPIEDNKYDLFIALQVWEHLNGKQSDAFREIMRISRMAILSFPLNWFSPFNCHNRITEEKISQWTLHIKPVKKIIVSEKKLYFLDRSKIIYFLKFKQL